MRLRKMRTLRVNRAILMISSRIEDIWEGAFGESLMGKQSGYRR